jgi:Skp family chaperone for outer membrane proteins
LGNQTPTAFMTRIGFIALAFVTVLTASLAVAQGIRHDRGTIAVVDFVKVFAGYSKSHVFKSELLPEAVPLKEKCQKLCAEMAEYQRMIDRADFSKHSRDELELRLRGTRQAWLETDRQIRDLFSASSRQELVEIWKDIDRAAKEYAESHGFVVVLGYGEPIDDKEQFSIVNRKVHGIDASAAVPLYVDPGCDITEGLIAAMNQTHAKQQDESAQAK